MTTLSVHHVQRIRLLAMSAIYQISADEGCDPSDVIAAITASQQSPHAPAAVPPAMPPAGETAEGVVPAPSASDRRQ